MASPTLHSAGFPEFLDAVEVGVVLVDGSGFILAANAASFGLVVGIPTNVRLPDVRVRLMDLLPAAKDILERLGVGGQIVVGGQARAVAVAAPGDAGATRTVDLIVAPLAGASIGLGACVACVTLVDTTGRSVAEGEIARLRGMLADTERERTRLRTIQAELGQEFGTGEMVGSSAALRSVKAQAARVGPTDTTVLIHGETGSGKELVARSIHALSKRQGQAFIAVNCAALPESLIESELFGHERGAFTGADRRRLGKFELADGGTLFLDEIAEMPLAAQAKLLRVLQEHAFERVGGAETVHVQVRLVAATHRDLARQVERGRFREDLFYRLNVFRIDVPPLRDRREDLRALAEHLHERAAKRMAKPVLAISDTSLRRLMAYPWPGNVRELANAVERATLLADGDQLEIELPESPLSDSAGNGRATGGSSASSAGSSASATRDILLDLSLEQLQRLQITHALESCGYRVFGKDGAAERLEMNPNTLLSKMDKFGIPRPRIMKQARKPG